MSSPIPPADSHPPTDRPRSGRGRRYLDRQDGRWIVLGLIALGLGGGLMVLRYRQPPPNRSGATAPADPDRPMTGTR